MQNKIKMLKKLLKPIKYYCL